MANTNQAYKERYEDLKIEDIKVVDFRRLKEETVIALEESIKFNGLINPITVEETFDGEYHLIAGYHRLQAYKLLEDVSTIPCKIRKFKTTLSDKEIDLLNNIAKQEENHIRQVFTIQEMSQDYIELENAYKQRFPRYAEDPLHYIEKYQEKLKARKRMEERRNIAKDKTDRKIASEKIKEIQADLQKITPPSENIKKIFPNASKTDIESARQIAESEKKNFGLIKTLVDDNLSKTTLNKIAPKLVEPKNVQLYMGGNKEERKDVVLRLTAEAKINKMRLDIEKLHDDVYRVGKIKTHCIAMINKIHLIPEKNYNVRINVENNNILQSTLESFDLEHFKVLVIFYDEKLFNNFVESFK